MRTNLIVSARISPLPKQLSDPLPEVWATLQDGSVVKLFEYYPDEIAFRADEFVGLTIEEPGSSSSAVTGPFSRAEAQARKSPAAVAGHRRSRALFSST
jgi:hypothetical protein